MATITEVIASAFASGMSWAETIEGHPLYCPPPIGTFTGNRAMSILESFIADHPETPEETYGLALSASCTRDATTQLIRRPWPGLGSAPNSRAAVGRRD